MFGIFDLELASKELGASMLMIWMSEQDGEIV